MLYLGDLAEDQTVTFAFPTCDSSGASVTMFVDGTISIYKDSSLSEITAGVTFTEDMGADAIVGVHRVAIDTSADAFYATGSDYMVVLSGATIDGQAVNFPLACFSIENRNIKANITHVSGDATAADNLETMLDGTGGQTLTLKSVVINNPAGIGLSVTGVSEGAVITGSQSGAVVQGGSFGLVIVDVAGGGNDLYLGAAGAGSIRGVVESVSEDAANLVGLKTWKVASATGFGAGSMGNMVKTNLDTTVSSRFPDSDGSTLTNIPKTGYKLASDGLDSVSTVGPNGVATNFRERLNQLYRRFFGKVSTTKSVLTTYRDDGVTPATTQAVAADENSQSVGKASSA